MSVSIQRLLNLNSEQLCRIPHVLPEYVKVMKNHKEECLITTLREVRDFAILKGDVSLLKTVMSVGCDCEFESGQLNPLCVADDYNGSDELEILLKAGAQVVEPKRLFYAAEEGSFKRMMVWMNYVSIQDLFNEKGENAWGLYSKTFEYHYLTEDKKHYQKSLFDKLLLERTLEKSSLDKLESSAKSLRL